MQYKLVLLTLTDNKIKLKKNVEHFQHTVNFLHKTIQKRLKNVTAVSLANDASQQSGR